MSVVQKVRSLRGQVGIKVALIAFPGALPIHLFRHFCCRKYRLATVISITDRQTDRHYYANS